MILLVALFTLVFMEVYLILIVSLKSIHWSLDGAAIILLIVNTFILMYGFPA